MLKIDNLHVRVAGRDILKGLSLDVAPGQVHAIMGPNGAGKSTLANVLAGRDGYDIVEGTVQFGGRDLLELEPEERAAAGVFLAFQYPVEIPGVNNTYFLRSALNAQRKARGESELDSMQFLKLVREKLAVLHLKDELLHRGVNEGFSGGEKKRNEIFQLAVLEPKLAILDETDSGLDIDALRNVAEGVNALRSPDRAFLVITHYQRLLDYIKPDVVHVLADGRIVESGGPELALELEAARLFVGRRSQGAGGCGLMSALLESLARGFEGDDARRATLDAALRDGLPKPRSEAWKYTSLRALERREFAPLRRASIDAALLAGIDGPRLVFVNGVFDAALSSRDALPSGVSLDAGSIAEPVDVGGPDRVFASLNVALASTGAILRVAADANVAMPLASGIRRRCRRAGPGVAPAACDRDRRRRVGAHRRTSSCGRCACASVEQHRDGPRRAGRVR